MKPNIYKLSELLSISIKYGFWQIFIKFRLSQLVYGPM